MKKKLLFWHYRFPDMKNGWYRQMNWVAKAFKKQGYHILKTKEFKCKKLKASRYVPERDRNSIDTVIYNHTDVSKLIGNVVPAKRVLFFKPTVPTPRHTTLDPLGYGPYSSITYQRPDFEAEEKDVQRFFNQKVDRWIQNKTTKWTSHKSYSVDVDVDDYYLVLGQCGGDSVVTEYDFGNYWRKMEDVIKELLRVGDRPVVVKLHPYTDGKGAKDDKFSTQMQKKYDALGKNVHVYKGKSNVHSFIKHARCVLMANSGAGFEVMMHHKPMIVWGCPEYRWISYDLRHLADIKRALTLDWFDRDLSDQFLYWYVEQYCFHNKKTCYRRVKELNRGR